MRTNSLLGLFAACTLLAQTGEEPVVLKIDVENHVLYRGVVFDADKLGRDVGPVPSTVQVPFVSGINVGDIVAINGTPVKGIWSSSFTHTTPYRTSPQPRQFIASVDAGASFFCTWQIFDMDGNFLGTLQDSGAAGGHAISGGLGGFFGMSGVHGNTVFVTPNRVASNAEDPANRRILGGGKWSVTFYLYPKIRPSVQLTPNGAAIFHEDWTPVNTANPARPGEVLVIGALGLGPVKPNPEIPPGALTFSASPLQEVNSPVTVTFNDQVLPVINKAGWPGQTTLYRVDFRVPESAKPGIATLQLTAMWIPGPVVTIPVASKQ